MLKRKSRSGLGRDLDRERRAINPGELCLGRWGAGCGGTGASCSPAAFPTQRSSQGGGSPLFVITPAKSCPEGPAVQVKYSSIQLLDSFIRDNFLFHFVLKFKMNAN